MEHRVWSASTNDGSPGGALALVARALAEAIGAPIALVSRFDAEAEDVVGGHGEPAAITRVLAGRQVTSFCRHVARAARPLVVHDVRRQAGIGADALHASGMIGYAGVPMVADGRVIGVLAAIDHVVHPWSRRDIENLRQHAGIATALLTRQHDERRADAAEAALGHERELVDLMMRAADGRIADALGLLAHRTRCEFVDVVTVSDDGRASVAAWFLVDQAHRGMVRSGTWPAAGDRLVRDALRGRRPTWRTGPPDPHDFAWSTGAHGADLHTALALPLSGHEAVLELFTSQLEPPRDEVEHAAAAIGAFVSRELRASKVEPVRDRRTAELEVFALHDDLTGLLNRRGFFALARSQLATAHRRHAAGLLVFLDIDGLKEVNDREGHASGDELLRAAGRVLRCVFPDTDSIGRIGGDEFVVLAVRTDAPKVASMSRTIAAELERINRERAPRTALRWSCGVATFSAAQPADLDALLSEADHLMYSAKRGQDPAA